MWAQFLQQGMQMAGGYYDTVAQAQDARTQKEAGFASSNANEERIRRENAYKLGQQRAAAAQSGFDPSTGSMLDLQGQSAANAELDALTERFKGQLNAWQQDRIVERGKDKMDTLLDPVGHRLGKASAALGFFHTLSYYGRRKLTNY